MHPQDRGQLRLRGLAPRVRKHVCQLRVLLRRALQLCDARHERGLHHVPGRLPRALRQNPQPHHSVHHRICVPLARLAPAHLRRLRCVHHEPTVQLPAADVPARVRHVQHCVWPRLHRHWLLQRLLRVLPSALLWAPRLLLFEHQPLLGQHVHCQRGVHRLREGLRHCLQLLELVLEPSQPLSGGGRKGSLNPWACREERGGGGRYLSGKEKGQLQMGLQRSLAG